MRIHLALALTFAVGNLFGSTGVAQTGLKLQSGTTPDPYIEVPYDRTLVPDTGFTVEAWITYDGSTLPPGFRWPCILRHDVRGSSESYVLRVDARDIGQRTLKLAVRAAAGFRQAAYTFAPGELKPWTHVAGTFDGQRIQLYVNGVLKDTYTYATRTTIANDGGVARIGNGDLSQPGTEVWNGEIDELRIWPYARTTAEIRSTMFYALSSVPGEVTTWNLDNNPSDSSGGNHGTNVNNPTYSANTLNLKAPTWTSQPFGAATLGCPRAIAPRINANGIANIDNLAFGINAIRGPNVSGGVGIAVLGVARLNSPIQVNSAALWIDPVFLILRPTLIPYDGYSSLALPIPDNTLLVGESLFAQIAFDQLGCGVYPFASDALEIQFTGFALDNPVFTPGPGTQNVEPTAVIRAQFCMPLDQTTITPQTFKVNDGFQFIDGQLSYESSTNTVVFTPEHRLGILGEYRVTVTRGIRSLSGLNLGSDVTSVFTTREARGWTPAIFLEAGNSATWGPLTQASSPGGTTILAWRNSNRIVASRYEPDQPTSFMQTSKQFIDNGTGTSVGSPVAAMDRAGKGYVAWIEDDQLRGSSYMPGMGWVLVPTPLSNTPQSFAIEQPDIVMDAASEVAFACWLEHPKSGTGQKLIGAAYDPVAKAWSGQETIATTTGTSYVTCQVAISRGTRQWIVVVLQDGNDLIAYQRELDQGSAWSAPARLNVVPGHEAILGDLLALTDGRVVISWSEDPDPQSSTGDLFQPIANAMDGNGQWGTAETLETGTPVSFPPQLAEGTGGGFFHVFFSRDTPDQNNIPQETINGVLGDPKKPWKLAFSSASPVSLSGGCGKVTRVRILEAGGGLAKNRMITWIEADGSCVDACVHYRRFQSTSGTWQLEGSISDANKGNDDLRCSTSELGESVATWTQSDTTTELVVRVFR